MLPNRSLTCLSAFMTSVAITACGEETEIRVTRSEYAATAVQTDELKDQLLKGEKLDSTKHEEERKA